MLHQKQTQAYLFAVEYAANAAKKMMDTITEIGTNSARITKIALGVSMPHQIGYILALAVPHMTWDLGNPSGFLESLTMVLLAIGVPIATDLLILNCIKVIGASAASRGSKRLALSLMLVPVAASGTVNFLAPAPTLIKVLAAFIVTVIPMSESLRAFTRPDFAKIEAMETETVAQVTPVPQAAQIKRRRGTARARIETILRETPDATIGELAQKAKTGYNNAHRIVTDIKKAAAQEA
jgi:hypothetical protein